jgi:phosphotransferase system HPr-like phosphotransfer protein
MEVLYMKTVQISLQMANQVKTFVSIVQKYSYDIDLRSERYVVDAKSILGIFSLDLSKPINVEIHSQDCNDLLEELKQFSK